MVEKFFILILLLVVLKPSVCQQTDITAPEIPVIDTVSVDRQTGAVYICWYSSPSPDVAGYPVYRGEGNPPQIQWICIDTVSDTTYIDFNADADKLSIKYRIAAIDSAGNLSQMSDWHNTIFTFAIYNKCSSYDSIFWTPYQKWEDIIVKYEIYCSVNNPDGPFSLINSVNKDINYYIYSIPSNVDATYYYIIRAINNQGKTSSSNKFTHSPEFLTHPQIVKANSASVEEYNQIDLLFTIDPYCDVDLYDLQKADSYNGYFYTIEKFFVDTNSPNIITYYDYLDIFNEINYYRIVAINICGDTGGVSNITHNILLNVKTVNDSINILRWNKFKGWESGVSYYNIYRIINNNTPELIGYTYGDTIYHDSSVTDYISTALDGNFCYYVEAVENTDSSSANTSRSNIDCVAHAPIIYFPNAFNPKSRIEKNKIFKPVGLFTSGHDYVFIIYDRWGEEIFKTNNPDKGWNGKIKKKFAPPDVYVFYVRFTTAQNYLYEKSGTFILIYD